MSSALDAFAQVAALFGLEESSPLLRQALTHPSYANEQRGAADNQRLEFLGDSVLGFCVSEILYAKFSHADEGRLTRYRAQLVNADALADWARAQDIRSALLLGRGASSLQDSTNVLADAVEALIAATFLDAGLDAARKACAGVVQFGLAALSQPSDAKSALQEQVQALGFSPPKYEVYETAGPAHAREFKVRAYVADKCVATGEGRSKRVAEMQAASAALEEEAWKRIVGVEEET